MFFGLALLVLSVCSVLPVRAQGSNQDRLMLSVGALYERGFDATVAWEHETKYHHAWEYFATGYLKYCDDPDAGHVTTKSFWDSYNTWHVGVAYKPCVSRGRNHHGNARLGISGGRTATVSSAASMSAMSTAMR